jgi:hypothetical protein
MFPVFTAAEFGDWGSRVTCQRVSTSVIEGDVKESRTSIMVPGLLTPMDADKINMKPEGQRDWHWWEFISFDVNNVFDHNDIVLFRGAYQQDKPHRIMSRRLFMAQGFVQYEVVEDFE